MAPKTDVTVLIGRFNPLHKGHAHVLEQALRNSKLTIVLIGSSGQARSLKNPFTFEERESMIERWHTTVDAGYDRHGLSTLRILPIRDYPYNDALWIRSVQSKVRSAITKFCKEHDTILTDIHVTGSDRDESTWYLHAFPQWKQALVEPYRQNGVLNVSATDVRRWMFEEANGASFDDTIQDVLPMTTRQFITSFMRTEAFSALQREYGFVKKYKAAWANAPYAPTFVTVDAVVVQSGHVLAVRRGAEPGKGLWALPGGFVNQNEKLRDASIRELLEETGIRLAEGKKAKEITSEILKGSIRESETFDKPDRDLRGRTITTAFLFRLDDTKPLPKVKGMDDAVDAFWIPIVDALDQTSMWYADHHAILETMIAYKDI